MSKAAGSDRLADVVVCRCEAVTLGEIRAALAEGVSNPMEVKSRTRTGMGVCQGRTCRAVVAALVSAARNLPPDHVEPFSARPPVRPVTLEDLAAGRVEGTVGGLTHDH